MNKTIWDKFAPVYSLAMKSQKSIYDYMYKHIADASDLHYEDKFFEVVPGRIDLMYAECVRK